MKKITVIGHFCHNHSVSDGQSIKTRIVTDELEKALGSENVGRIDTFGWKKHPFKLLFNCILSVRDSSNVIFMTDAGGIKVFPWLLVCANVFYKRSLHYVVVGGWLVSFLEKNKFIAGFLKKFDNIFCETSSMIEGLERLGFDNMHLMPNFKKLNPLNPNELNFSQGEPYAFCTFSRVMKEKGIEDAVEAVKAVNSRFGRTVCKLDIYGAIEPLETDWFENISSGFSEEIKYCGVAPFDKSVEILKNYFALLFPTFYPSEGIPGTIIDAYSAGLPVIASRWSGFRDIVDEGVTGIGFPYMENRRLEEILAQLISEPEIILNMKKNCLEKANCFSPESVIGILLERLS